MLQDLLERRNSKRKFADRNAFLDAVEDTMRSFASIGDTNSMLQFWELTRYMLLLKHSMAGHLLTFITGG